ncbi:MAG: ROK family protein [Deltaproteobacteria bacterium]|nr:MAG: ROK family protein [Deltaproteobacteria bacterium]
MLGIDVGGSALKGAPVDTRTGTLTAARLLVPTPRPATPAAIAATVAGMARHFAWQGPLGCGIPAVVRDGRAGTAANIDHSWIGTDVGALFGAATGCPVTVLNDADAAGLAEMRFGAGKGQRGTVILVTIGTGLGTALFHDGVLVPNTELGHLRLPGDLVAEHFASAAAKRREQLDWPAWAGRLNLYLGQLDAFFSPDLIILGGAISGDFAAFSPGLSLRAAVCPALLGNDAGIVGAALAAAPPP